MNRRIRKKKEKQLISEAVSGLVELAKWQEEQRKAAIRQFVKDCEALYEKNREQRKEELTQLKL